MYWLTGVILLFFGSCDFVKIDPPRTDLIRSTVFDNDATAEAAMLDIYHQLYLGGFASGDARSISYLASICSDEQLNYFVGDQTLTLEFQQFNDNALLSKNSIVLGLWSDMYKGIYKANAIIEGLQSSTGVSESVRARVEGEAKFIRAFCHFYLVNLWGDIPLVLTTDYQVNASMGRTPADEVYQQIVTDLKEAQEGLPNDYSGSKNERVRVNKGAATALLARTYLYRQDWANAEVQSTALINDTQYSLVENLNDVSTKNNAESIWQFWSDTYPNDLFTFYIFSSPSAGALRDEFVNGFEDGDQRKVFWISKVGVYFFSVKYASFDLTEYSTVLRLGEQYLIRAEARTHLNLLDDARNDINTIRHRAGLGDTPADDVETLLAAVEQERRSELVNEWGHRWLDLKRTNRADAVLSSIKTQWISTATLFPIPESEMLTNEGLINHQNPGY